MKIVHSEVLIAKGDFPKSAEWAAYHALILKEIRSVDWPPGSGSFSIFPQSGKKRGEGSGVKPIKDSFVTRLLSHDWQPEVELDIASRKKPGKLDLVKKINGRSIAIEWETGNISSSHRALNKLALGLLKEVLIAGILIVPSRELYKYLTDRIGNYDEIEPYNDLWRSLPVKEGVLEILVVEHDRTDPNVARIPKGTDGRAIT